MTTSLRSSAITAPSSLLRTPPPLCSRIGTLVLAVTDRLDFSLNIGTTGSCVPYRSPSQGHAAFMPDAGWSVGRLPPTLARGTEVQIPVSTSMNTLRHVISGLLAFFSLSHT